MKKGFTLIELLAVIAVLAIVLLIAVPYVINLINDVKTNALLKDEDMLIKAANNYVAANQYLIPNNIGDSIQIRLSDLETNNYIGSIKDTYSGNSCNGYVLVTRSSTSLDYIPYLKCDNAYDSYTADGLLSYYRLDNNSYDLTPSNYDGVNIGGVGANNRFGVANKAMYFDGASTTLISVNGPLTGVFAAQKFSWGGWIKVDNALTSNGRILMSQNNVLELSINTSLRLYATTKDAIGYQSTPMYTLSLNTWYHFFVTCDGTTTTLYINGNQTGTVTSAGFQDPSNNIFIGNWSSGQGFKGTLDEIRTYNRNLSSNEIKRIYDSEKNINR